MAKTKVKTDLATRSEADAMAELSDFFDAQGVDGLEEFDGEDIKISSLLWNMRGKDKDGRSMTKDVFFDTITEDTTESVDLVFLTTKKTKRWDEFDNDKDRTVVHCESVDRVTGTLADGTRRPCAGCPDDGWFTDADGKTKRKCGEVHNAVAIEVDSQRPVMIRFKKTGLKPFRQYCSAYHKGARVVVGKDGRRTRRNVPLFAYTARLALKMSDNGMYATPVIRPVEQSKDADGNPVYLMPTEDVMTYAEHAKAWVDMMGEAMSAADKQTAAYDAPDAADSGTVIDADAFADD